MEDFNLCKLCTRAESDSCSMYRKNPNATVLDCGSFKIDESKSSYEEAIGQVVKMKGGIVK